MKAVGYARYSTNNQTENSIAYQMGKIQSYCYENDITLMKFYIDEAKSGTNLEREGFINMLNAARNGDFEAVVIYDISRGSRNVSDWFSFRNIMSELGVKVISCTQNIGDLENSNDFLIELLTVGLGHREVLETRQKSMDGVAVKAKQGIFLGGTPPLGYDIVDGRYTINNTEAQIVRKIFNMYANDCGYAEIIDALKGFKGKKGRSFSKSSLSAILRNERYIGTYFWNKRKVKHFRKWAGGKANPNVIKIENAHPGIIEKSIWEVCQMRLGDNTKNAQHKAKREYLLSGIIECASCGGSYVGHTARKISKTGKEYVNSYYTCVTKKSKKECTSKNINADELETFVVAQLKDYLKNANFKEVAENLANGIESGSSNIGEIKRELIEVDAKIKNGTSAILKGLDYPELQEEIENLRIRKSELEDIIKASNNNKKIDPKAIENIFRVASENILQAESIRPFIKAFVPKIYINPDGSASVNIGISVDMANLQDLGQKNKPEFFGLTDNSGEGI